MDCFADFLPGWQLDRFQAFFQPVRLEQAGTDRHQAKKQGADKKEISFPHNTVPGETGYPPGPAAGTLIIGI